MSFKIGRLDLLSSKHSFKERPMSLCRKTIFSMGLCLFGASAQVLANNPCRDPWISELAPQVWSHPVRGSGETGECNINLYGRNWNNKDQLRSHMQAAKRAFDSAGIEFDAANPQLIHDIKYYNRMQLGGNNIGPKGSVPPKNWMIDLPNGYVFAIERRCRPGYSAAGPTAGSGCVK